MNQQTAEAKAAEAKADDAVEERKRKAQARADSAVQRTGRRTRNLAQR